MEKQGLLMNADVEWYNSLEDDVLTTTEAKISKVAVSCTLGDKRAVPIRNSKEMVQPDFNPENTKENSCKKG